MRLPLTRSSRESGAVSMVMRPVIAVADARVSLWPCDVPYGESVLAPLAGVSAHAGQHGRLPLTWIAFAPVLSVTVRLRPMSKGRRRCSR